MIKSFFQKFIKKNKKINKKNYDYISSLTNNINKFLDI